MLSPGSYAEKEVFDITEPVKGSPLVWPPRIITWKIMIYFQLEA